MKKVLIANRGEIAVRIARACRAKGLKAVAVYSEADASSPHVTACDEAVCIGAPAATESYLVQDKILEAARSTGADAIHPGFGFLSENAGFARAVVDAGLIFIGPAPEAMEAMGKKIEARRTMEAAGVPVVPGVHSAGQDLDALVAAADAVGFPVLVKASAGGGGKGMRAVHAPSELRAALESARREAASAFGDDAVYIERLLIRPRHVEIQVFGDSHGQVVHLGERECSIQRRHQKILEETPSPAPAMTPALRAQMGAAAVAAAQAVSYVGAGTVEFMLDEGGEFFFLEMNTRLQVEHPITELVYGVDLVAAQLDVADGAPLPWTQAQLTPRGHAIEVRLYAEDPAKAFLPSIGPLLRYRPPVGPGIRYDGGVVENGEVSVHYDPMMAKLIAYGEDRAQATGRLYEALSRWDIHGVETNRRFLMDVLAHAAFAAGDTHTGFIDQHWPDGVPATLADEAHWIALALSQVVGGGGAGYSGGLGAAGKSESDGGGLSAPWDRVGPWRSGGA